GVLLRDGDLDAVTDVDAEVGVVAGEGANETDGGGALGAAGRRLLVTPTSGEKKAGHGEESGDPPAEPRRTGHVNAPLDALIHRRKPSVPFQGTFTRANTSSTSPRSPK